MARTGKEELCERFCCLANRGLFHPMRVIRKGHLLPGLVACMGSGDCKLRSGIQPISNNARSKNIELLSIAITLFAIALNIFILTTVLIPMLLGAPFVPIDKTVLKRMIALLQVQPGEKAADLGSGDGRIVIELAKAGVRAHGYEINPLIVLTSRKNIKNARISQQASIHWKSFWNQDFSSFQIITLFGMPHMMKKLQEKLSRELKPGARVISHQFMFPDWQISQQESQLYLYRIS